MPKGDKQAQRETRKQQMRRAREERQERMLFLVLGAVALVALIIFGLGVLSTNYGGLGALLAVQFNQPIATVNGKAIPIREYQAQLRYSAVNLNAQLQQATLNLQQINTDPTLAFLKSSYEQQQQQLIIQLIGLPREMMETLIEDELVRQEAARRNLSVTADEVDQEIEQYVGYFRATPTPTAGPLPTPTKTGTPTRTPAPSPLPTGTIMPTTPTATPTVGPT
ncbi:MAG: SurA N-terminal domain-containing protein, partial [Anaerolineales bacterium]|nr:SurA N-terminal domain-containing protein [Anaerolineales bacterium]